MSKQERPSECPWRGRRRWTTTEAQRMLEALERSGLSVAAFAAEEGIDAQRVYRWRQRFALDRSRSSPVFIEVRPPVVGAGSGDRYEVVLTTGVVVRVPAEFEAGVLRRLVAALEGSGSC